MNEYVDPRNDPFVRFVVPVLLEMNVRAVAEESGQSARTVRRVRSGESRPHSRARAALTAVAVRQARARLAGAEIEAPRGDLATLQVYKAWLNEQMQVCPVCGQSLANRKAIYCSARCRKRAWRGRHTVVYSGHRSERR